MIRQLSVFALLFALSASPAIAQDEDFRPTPTPAVEEEEAGPTPPVPLPELNEEEEAPVVPAPVEDDEVAEVVPPLRDEEAALWRLLGGGEVVGTLIKQTPGNVFIDIGPTIIDVPASSVIDRIYLSELSRQTESEGGLGSGAFDSETGSLVFRSREGGTQLLSQQEILENVKRGVVLVSNPGGLGTGWMYDDEGRIVTNHHVTGGEVFQTVTIFVKNGPQWERRRIENCTVEASSSLMDIAIVKIDMDKLREQGLSLYPLPIAPPDTLQAGDSVYAVGNPGMGRIVLDHSISEGIVSSTARNLNDILYLQTTAAVNPGNSGGPLINQRGEVVGLITLKAAFQEGVAFALPVEYVRHFLENSRAFAIDESRRAQSYRYHSPQ